MKSPRKKSDIDLQELLASPDYDVEAAGFKERKLKEQTTDLNKLRDELGGIYKAEQRLTLTDHLVDIITPFMIFFMVLSLVWYLLDVRYIFTETSDGLFRIVAFCLVMGVVALNRLIAQSHSNESSMYVFGLVGVTAGFTIMISMVDGSVAKGVMDSGDELAREGGGWDFALLPLIFNGVVVTFLWWLANRLTHECCVDENYSAGDIGIMTGTLQNLKKAIEPIKKAPDLPAELKKQVSAVAKETFEKKEKRPVIEQTEVNAFDPLDWKDPDKEQEIEIEVASTASRLNKRHPGISIFYFSIPAMIVFAMGLPVLRQGGRYFELKGHFFVAIFTISALSLLMLSSLGGLRAYFRIRKVRFPAKIGVFWVGLGAFMILIVLLGAVNSPMPQMPAMAHVEEHETDYWSKNSRFELAGQKSGIVGVVKAVDQSNAIQYLSVAVLAGCILFGMYGATRGILIVAGNIGQNRHEYPRWIVRFFEKLDQALQKVSSLPALPGGKILRVKIHPARSQSYQFENPMKGEAGKGDRERAEAYIAYAYDAMCALAYDMGVPRKKDQTPYEFLKEFPREMKPILEEAEELTHIYVKSAYSNFKLDDRVLDRVRKFWIAFDALRKKYTVRDKKPTKSISK